jgi:L-ascorbate metabolism protein UlaG (beta-lactamase superfamily)
MRRLLVLLVALAACSTVPLPRRSPYHPADADLSVTRIVHASLIVEMRGTRVLVDPWFYSGFVMRQQEPLGLTPPDLPGVAAILLTHEHGGHTDDAALRQLAPSVPEVIAPARLTDRLRDLGFQRVTALAWWETATIGDVRITAVPAAHSVPENGYVLERDGVSAYLAGDTREFDELGEVAARFPHLNAALLPVGGERLFGFPRTMGPTQAAEAAAKLGAERVIPIAYGKQGGFPVRWFTRKPVPRFVAACKDAGIGAERIVVLEPGESWHYYRPRLPSDPDKSPSRGVRARPKEDR